MERQKNWGQKNGDNLTCEAIARDMRIHSLIFLSPIFLSEISGAEEKKKWTRRETSAPLH
jgi:hypothetical protein